MAYQLGQLANNSGQSICEALGGDPVRYTRLHARQNTRPSRKIVGTHFRRTIQSAFIKELHEDFSDFLATALGRAALTGVDPNRYTGDVKIDIKASELLSAGSWEAVVALISSKIFRALENEKSTKKLISKISSRLGVDLDDGILDAAMPYLDARHILVHADGIADETYKENYGDIALHEDRLIVNFAFIESAKATILALAGHMDQKFLEKGFVPDQFVAGPNPSVASQSS